MSNIADYEGRVHPKIFQKSESENHIFRQMHPLFATCTAYQIQFSLNYIVHEWKRGPADVD